jgi:hypothetical protein
MRTSMEEEYELYLLNIVQAADSIAQFAMKPGVSSCF